MVHTTSKFSECETDTLDALWVGLGVSPADLDNLFEQCDHCGQTLMWSTLHVHIKEVEVDQENDVKKDMMTESIEEDTDISAVKEL